MCHRFSLRLALEMALHLGMDLAVLVTGILLGKNANSKMIVKMTVTAVDKVSA